MRVERALDKMHAALAGRGVMSTTAALAVALANQVGVAAPAGLAAAVAGVALGGSGVAAGVAASGSVGITAATFMSMSKLQLGLAGVVALAGTTGFVVQAQSGAQMRDEIERLRQESRNVIVLKAENDRLATMVTEAADLRTDDAELRRLRDEAETLRTSLLETARAKATAAAVSSGQTAPVYNIAQLDQIPQPRFRTPPTYPVEMRQAGVTGQVVIDFVVNDAGDVHSAFAAKSSRPEFEEAAVTAVSKWKFQPGRKSQLPVNTRMQIPIVFSLAGDKETAAKQAEKKALETPNWF
jgi:TonB family protein